MNRAELRRMAEAEQERQERLRCRIMVCAGTPCLTAGALAVLDSLREALGESRLDAEIEAVACGCMGPCSRGPLVKVRQQGKKETIFERVTPDLARQILFSLAKTLVVQGGMLLAQTARDTTPLRAALTSVLHYIGSYAT